MDGKMLVENALAGETMTALVAHKRSLAKVHGSYVGCHRGLTAEPEVIRPLVSPGIIHATDEYGVVLTSSDRPRKDESVSLPSEDEPFRVVSAGTPCETSWNIYSTSTVEVPSACATAYARPRAAVGERFCYSSHSHTCQPQTR